MVRCKQIDTKGRNATVATEYEYKYVRIKLKGEGFTGKFSESYQNEINACARDGWRFVQAFALAVVGYGASS